MWSHWSNSCVHLMSQPEACPANQNIKIEAERILARQHSITEEKEKLEKARKAGRYLRLMVHSLECRGDCNNPDICKNAKLLYHHCIVCTGKQSCPIAGCHQTKKLLHHVTLCRWDRQRRGGASTTECLVCSSMTDNSADDQTSDRTQSSTGLAGFAIPTAPKRFRADSMPSAGLMSIQEEGRTAANRSTSFNHDSEGKAQRLASLGEDNSHILE